MYPFSEPEPENTELSGAVEPIVASVAPKVMDPRWFVGVVAGAVKRELSGNATAAHAIEVATRRVLVRQLPGLLTAVTEEVDKLIASGELDDVISGKSAGEDVS